MPQCTMVTEYNQFDGVIENNRTCLYIHDNMGTHNTVLLDEEEIDSLYLFLINNFSHILSHYWKDGFKPVKETT